MSRSRDRTHGDIPALRSLDGRGPRLHSRGPPDRSRDPESEYHRQNSSHMVNMDDIDKLFDESQDEYKITFLDKSSGKESFSIVYKIV